MRLGSLPKSTTLVPDVYFNRDNLRGIMKYEFKCEVCGKLVKKLIWKGYKPRFCSRECANSKSFNKSHEVCFSWDLATDEQKKYKIRQNFYRDVIIRNGCWKWKKVKEKDGYARVEIGKRKVKQAHIVSYLIHKGDIPKGMLVLHSCHCRDCTNPEHLHLGSHKQNMKEMVEANRQCKGSIHHNAKLMENDVVEIKKMLKNNKLGIDIAKKFNVSSTIISNIRLNKIWKHITLEEKI